MVLMPGFGVASPEFEIGNDTSARVERPFESERVNANAVSGVRLLNDQEDWDGVDRVFKTAAEKTRAVRSGKDQAVTKANVPDSIARLTATKSVTAAGPDLQLVAASDRAGLRARSWGNQECTKDE